MLPKSNKQQLTFKKNERLKSRKSIQSLFVQNQNLRIFPFKLVWLKEPTVDQVKLKIGVSVSKRHFKSAVKRNKIKRIMRECLRYNKQILLQKINKQDDTLSLMLVYVGSEIIPFKEFNSKIKYLLFRLGDKLNN